MSARPSPDRLNRLSLVVFDVDGVLTDGRLFVTANGETAHAFHVRDGLAFIRAHDAGLNIGIISGRRSASVSRRMRELKVTRIEQGIADKASCLLKMCGDFGIEPARAAFVGDDVNDLPAMRVAGLAVTVPDAAVEVREHVKHQGGWVLSTPGGHGAARELLQAVLEAHGRWLDEVGKVP